MTDRIEKICESASCTGCGLCENICPHHAISMKPNNNFGHKRPLINNQVCIKCGLCIKKCPANDEVMKIQSWKCYAAWQLHDEKHYTSSSGGIAAALYENAIKNGNWIVGVEVGENLEPRFVLSNRIEQINEFKGSKYVQPVTGRIYCEVAEKLQRGEKVIFIGLPCHCAAMKRYAETIKGGELVLVDMVCHGIPAYNTLMTHIKHIEEITRKSTKVLFFRDRNAGVCLDLQDENKSFYKRFLHEDVFMHSFISGDLFEENCYRCKYACSERVGDLTICDFWGIGKLEPFNHKISRVSAILINSDKGKKEFEQIRDLVYCEKRRLQEAVEGNIQLQHPSLKGKNRVSLLEFAKEGRAEFGLYKIYGKLCEGNYKKRQAKDRIKYILKLLRF